MTRSASIGLRFEGPNSARALGCTGGAAQAVPGAAEVKVASEVSGNKKEFLEASRP